MYMPLATDFSVTWLLSLPPAAVMLPLYTTWPSMSVTSTFTSSLAWLPSVPLMVNDPLFGLGNTVSSTAVAIVFTPTPLVVTVIVTDPAPVWLPQGPEAVAEQDTTSPLVRLLFV